MDPAYTANGTQALVCVCVAFEEPGAPPLPFPSRARSLLFRCAPVSTSIRTSLFFDGHRGYHTVRCTALI